MDAVIRCSDGAFDEPVSKRAVYSEILKKIYQKGRFIYAYNEKVLGYCAFYANDAERKKAYISLIAVAPEYQNMHIGTKLINESFKMMRDYGMKQCILEVRKNNQKAIHFYKTKHFSVLEERENSYLMKCEL